jgi:hypothetical protein
MSKRKFLVVYKVKGTATGEIEAENEEEAQNLAHQATLTIEDWDAVSLDEIIDQGEA